ncbi:hypothetical protein EIN_284570, partial [Entamoeba invadens IP1]
MIKPRTEDVIEVLGQLEADIRDIETTEAMIRGDINYDTVLHSTYLPMYEQFQLKHQLAFSRRQLKQTLEVKGVLARRFNVPQ